MYEILEHSIETQCFIQTKWCNSVIPFCFRSIQLELRPDNSLPLGKNSQTEQIQNQESAAGQAAGEEQRVDLIVKRKKTVGITY